MRNAMRLVPFAAALALLSLCAPAHATTLRLGVGADYWFEGNGGNFELLISAHAPIGRHVSIGGRFGGMFATRPNDLGVPLDLSLRGTISGRVYLEGLVGPWFLFDSHPLHAHAAFGFGFLASGLELGFELGWLDPSPVAGVRLAFSLGGPGSITISISPSGAPPSSGAEAVGCAPARGA